MNPEPSALDPGTETIVCPVAPWYFRRMGILAVMMMGMGLYFIYDGKYGYAKDNEIVRQKEWFQKEYLKSFDEAKAAGALDHWIAEKGAAGQPTGENGEPPKWTSYAAKHGWPEEPKKHSDGEILEQFEYGGALIAGTLVVGVVVLLNKNKKLIGHAEHMIMPDGAEVRYADAFKVDKRKWDHKGLAYVHHRREGVERRVTVDDLKYGGAGKVLARLLLKFKGELIEKVPEEIEADDVSTPS